MLKKSRKTLLAVCLALALAAPPALAEDIIFPFPDGAVQEINSIQNSVAPSGSYSGKSNSLSGNSVTVNGNVAGDVYGAVNIKDAAALTNNRVFINSGVLVGGSVYGGYSLNGNAIGNSVTILGGTFADDAFIYGGYSEYGNATHNTVTIYGTPALSVQIAGGFSNGGDAFTGNTLNLRTARLAVDGLANFEFLNFYLPAPYGAGDTMLFIGDGGAAHLTDYGGRFSVVNLDIDGAASPLKTGESVVLIDASAGSASVEGKPDNDTADGLHGVTLRYRFGLGVENGEILRATVLSVGADEPAKALSEGYLSGLALLNRGVDLAAGPGIIRHGKGIFALVDGGSSRYDTGSNIDVDSLSLLAGVSGVTPFSAGTLTLAGFLSYGRGDYDTYNSFANAASVRGQGGSDYTGLGALARFDFSGSDTGHPYAEAHFQGGRVKTDFYSGDLVDVLGRSARYDTSSNYYGAHIGAGYVRNIAGGGELDLYAKYLYARRGGDSVRLDSGDPVSFDSVNSHRLRVGGRYAWRANNLRPYVGLAWEYEFDGRANAAAYGYPIDAPDMEGDTGIVELGFTLTPSGTERLLIDLGVQAYTGQREGVSGNVKLEYMF